MRESIFSIPYIKLLKSNKQDLNSELNITAKIALLKNITIEPLIPFLQYQCYSKNINPEFFLNDHDNIIHDAIDKNSKLYKFKPDIIYLILSLENFSEKLFNSYSLENDEIENEISKVIEFIRLITTSIRQNSQATIIIKNFEENPYLSSGISEILNKNSNLNITKKINESILNMVKKYKNVYILDINLSISKIGYENFIDNRNYFTSKNPYSELALRHISFEASKYIASIKGLTKKCIVLDCDNTLWAGIVGEDGLSGIQCGRNFPGSYYYLFQKKLLNLKKNGFLLAINSKNNFQDVIDVFDKHPEILLKKNDFASIKINWEDKVKNLADISNELNISLDHIVFIDDSEFEVEMVHKLLPQVETILMPKNLSMIPNVLHNRDFFDRIDYIGSDINRTEFFIAENQRLEEKKKIRNISEYLNELKLCTRISSAKENEITRIAELTQKTNQFNLTTKRYNEVTIENYINAQRIEVISIEAEDKFGDYGLIGVGIIKNVSDYKIIDTFLMSCRALGRGIEIILLKECIKVSLNMDSKALYGIYIPTNKNLLVKDFYPKNGFEVISSNKDQTKFKWTQNNLHELEQNHILEKKK